MRRIFPILILILYAFSGKAQEVRNAQIPVVGLSVAQAEWIHDHSKIFPNGTQLAFALIDGQKTLFYGVERRNDSLYTINNSDAVFEIGSITKVFTATLLAQEVINGNLTLNQKVSDLLTMEFHTGNDITLGELASHTSGMPRLANNFFGHVKDQTNPYKDYGPEVLTDYLSNGLEVLKKEYAYSNTGFAVLGLGLSRFLERSYAELIFDRILDPLDMQNTVIGAENAGDHFVPGLNHLGNPTSNWDMNVHAPAGGLLSSVADLEKFARAQFDPGNKALVLTRKVTNTIREDLFVGLGWHERHFEEGKWHSHSGGTGGYTSLLVVDIENQKAVILLSNVSAFQIQNQKVEQLGSKLMRSLY